MAKGEFIPVTIGQWEVEYNKLPSARLGKNPLPSSEVYFRLQPVKEILALPSQRDYYQPEREALVMETMRYFPLEVKRGVIAFAVGMAKEEHLPSRTMGINLCRSIADLREWLDIPFRPDSYIIAVLAVYKWKHMRYNMEGTGASIVRHWQGEDPQVPLEGWFRQKAQSASA